MAIDEHTLHFVGGQGDKTGGSPTGGGCTRAEWENSSGINQTLDNIMGTNGEPLCDGTTADATIGGTYPGYGNYVRLTRTAGDSFAGSGVKVGTIVYVNFAGTYIDGYYIIVAVGDGGGDVIDIKAVVIGNQAGNTCYVGGAFDDLQDALDNVPVGSAAMGSRWIYTCLDETATFEMNTDGDKDEDAHVWIIGYNTSPGDMNPGEAYEGDYIDLDGDNASDHGFTISSKENVHLWNLYIHNVDSSHDCVSISSCYGIEVFNCKLDDGRYGVVADTSEYGIIVRGCTFETALSNNSIRLVSSYGVIINNIIKDSGTSRILSNIGEGIVSGNIFIGGAAAIHLGGITHLVTLCNNTFYNQDAAAIRNYSEMVQRPS